MAFLVQELLVSPYMLLQNNIPVVRCVQNPGEFIINYPGKFSFTHADWCRQMMNVKPSWRLMTSAVTGSSKAWIISR